MKDIRISIRLTEEEHEAFKILAIKRKKQMQKILVDFVRSEIEKEKQNAGSKKRN